MKKLFLLIVMLAMAAIACNITQEFTQEVPSDEELAFKACQPFVTRHLVSPSTAEFPPFEEVEVQAQTRNIFRVHGYVDSQNRYGAMMRSVYVCDIQRAGEDWSLIRRIEFPFDQN